MDDWRLPKIAGDLCDGCGACVVSCPTEAVDMGSDGPVIARPADCTFCTTCEAMCPRGAIRCEFEITWGDR